MDIEVLKKILERRKTEHDEFIRKATESRRYYKNDNDITIDKSPSNENKEATDNPLRKADNRVSNNYHQLLVDQKAAFALTSPPLFDVDDVELNKSIVRVLGDEYPKIAKKLCIDASNCSIAWLHVWVDQDNEFQYEVVDPVEIIPIFSKTLKKKLVGCIRVYEDFDLETGEEFVVFQYWNGQECRAYKAYKNENEEFLIHNMFERMNEFGEIEYTNEYKHPWSEHNKVPFIPFWNNDRHLGDLKMYKGLIDIYDKVYNGFVNDVEDVQEIIFILKGYGGTSISKFIEQLKKGYIKLNENSQNKDSGIDTLTVEIPTEARDIILERTRKRIWESGQGMDPLDDKISNTSGSALRFKYSLLELKADLMETEFKLAFSELIRFILIHLGQDPKKFRNVKQTWTRTAINNDLELAQVVNYLAPVTSKENLAKANPIVEDYEAELQLQRKEEQDEMRMEDDYTNDDLDELKDEDTTDKKKKWKLFK